jgi:hypothetical protein
LRARRTVFQITARIGRGCVKLQCGKRQVFKVCHIGLGFDGEPQNSLIIYTVALH